MDWKRRVLNWAILPPLFFLAYGCAAFDHDHPDLETNLNALNEAVRKAESAASRAESAASKAANAEQAARRAESAATRAESAATRAERAAGKAEAIFKKTLSK